MAGDAITNAFTIDVEDYFQVSALAPHIDRSTWDDRPCRVERNVARLLELLSRHGAHATFFTLGWIAKRYPHVVREIVGGGHELASHGFGHLRASEQAVTDFRVDVRHAKHLLEDIAGRSVLGYRAPSFSIGYTNPWAFDVLVEEGYRYSSSVYPVQHDHYGMPDAPRFPYQVRPQLLEIPLTTARVLGRNLPAGGGGYFRLAPYGLSRWALRRVNRIDRRPAIFYMHPWEIDPEQPRVPGTTLKTRFRHYVNLHRTEERLSRLLQDFRWGRVDEVFGLSEGRHS
ncbi:MAG TPA: XrtA system polysaccharide deacetylase [Burkholderiaceae bacterium]|nr:XrtA system polysaccharide deacetylase [Burkholderiaceae bacterium]